MNPNLSFRRVYFGIRFRTCLLVFLHFSLYQNLRGQESAHLSIEVMTYNIRVDFPDTSLNSWNNRKEDVAGLIHYYQPDILATQEGKINQIEFILDNTGDLYQYSGVGRDNGGLEGEFCAIFYKKEKFQVLEGGNFWLSQSPDSVSVGWDAALPRICSFVLLEETVSQAKFWVLNTHFDHVGKKARLESVKLILQEMEKLNSERQLPVILMGDFNLEPDSAPMVLIRGQFRDARDYTISPAYGPEGTFNAFQFDKIPKRRIDYIFTNEKVGEVVSYRVIDDFRNFRYPSDHLPVFVQLKF